MNRSNNPTAIVLLRDGTDVAFYDYVTGAALSPDFEGVCRLYVGGTVDATMRTTFDKKTGYRLWLPIKEGT